MPFPFPAALELYWDPFPESQGGCRPLRVIGMVRFAVPVLFLSLALPAGADEVVLRNGAAFSGSVREDGDRVVLELDFGTMSFRRSEVREIRRSDDPLKELEQRLKSAKDAKSLYETAVWAREKGLNGRANDLLRKVIALEPGHGEARKALGFEQVNGLWLEGDELRVAKGYVRHQGRWLKKETAEAFRADDTQLRIEQERGAAAERIAKLQAEVDRARIAVERERVELERNRIPTYGWGMWGTLPWGVVVRGAEPCGTCASAPCRCRVTAPPAAVTAPPRQLRSGPGWLAPLPPLPPPITGRQP